MVSNETVYVLAPEITTSDLVTNSMLRAKYTVNMLAGELQNRKSELRRELASTSPNAKRVARLREIVANLQQTVSRRTINQQSKEL